MKTILLVEDDESLVKALRLKLEKNNFKVLVAKNGEEALIKTAENDPDLILLDLVMPKMDGQTFYSHFRNSTKKDIPVIVLTNLVISAIPDGITETLIKSDTSLDEIINKIKTYLE